MYEDRRFDIRDIAPPVTRNIIFITALVWLAQLLLPSRLGIDLNKLFAMHYFEASLFRLDQLITYMFLHSTESFHHLFFNMFGLWMFGSVIERFWGGARFLTFYFATGISAALVQQAIWYIDFHEVALHSDELIHIGGGIVHLGRELLNMPTTVGASGAIYGILLAFGMLLPNSIIFLYFFPIKAKYAVLIYGALELFLGLTSSSNIAHFAHLGGMIGGIILILLWRRKGKIHGPYN